MRSTMSLPAASGLLLLLSLGAAPALFAGEAYSPDANAPRSEVPDEFKWSLDHLYETPEKWDAERDEVEKRLPELRARCEGNLADSGDMLHGCISDAFDTMKTVYRLYVYAGRAHDEDQSDEVNRVRNGRIQMLVPRFSEAISFMEPEILAMDPETLNGYVESHAGLQEYSWYLENVQRMRPWTLPPGEERILALAGNVSYAPKRVHEALLNVDYTFPSIMDDEGNEVELTVTGFTKYRGSNDPEVRKAAAEAFFGGLRTHRNTFASLLDGIVKAHIMNKEARGYESCLEASLTPDNISTEVYHNLVDTINANLGRTLHKYVDLRRKILGIEGPLTFDNLYNPLLDEVDAEYTYDEAVALITEASKPMGPDYVGFLVDGMDPESGWVDIYPNAKKASGAYMSGAAYDVHPYVLMNYDNTMDSLFTLAHEYGHAMHSVYSSQRQPFHYAHYATFNAEIASTATEQMLLTHLLKKAKRDPEMKLALLNQRLENIRLTIFRQTLFAEFELAMHEHAEKGQPITADFLENLYGDLVKKYYGPNYELGEDDVAEWAFIPHFFYDFYVFSYATGLTAGISIANQVENNKDAAELYKTGLLAAGSSKPPLEILKDSGVDLETTQPILDMLDLFEETLDQFDKELTKLEAKKAKKRGK